MDAKTEDKHIDGQKSCRQPLNCLKDLQSLSQLYENGIKEVDKNWLSSLLDFLKNRSDGVLVVVVAIVCLFGIAKEFVSNRNDGFDSFAFIGSLTIALLIFVLALIALLRAICFNHAKNIKKQTDEKAQLRVGRECSNENGDASG